MAKIKIAVDCGHGANTAGKRTPAVTKDIDFQNDGKVDVKKGGSIREHQANVGIGEFLSKELTRCGFDVLEVAFGAEDVPITTRQKQIKTFGAVASISNHFNASGGDGSKYDNAEGVSIYVHDDAAKVGDSVKLAETVLKYLLKGTPQKDRGIGKGGLGLCNCPGMKTKASILVEYSFMTNKREAEELMGSAKYWKECAVEVAKGVCEYFKVSYVPEKTTVTAVVKVDDSGLNVRQTPNTLHDPIKILKNGTPVEIIFEENGWAKIHFGSSVGFVNAKYLVKQ